MSDIALIYSGGELVQRLEPYTQDNTCWGARTGCAGDLCGGCDHCLLMQAVHYGCQIEWEDEMPIQECQADGKPGFKYGESGTCYTYTAGNEDSKNRARAKAVDQAQAIKASQGSKK